jgi:hypothetical protein
VRCVEYREKRSKFSIYRCRENVYAVGGIISAPRAA